MSTTLLKNVASQRVRVYAYTPADGLPKTGDAANLTCYIAKDYGAVTALTDTSATEEDATNAPGYYWFDISQTESNADNIMVTAKSATSGVKVLGAPAIIGTRPATGFLAPATAGRTLVVDAAGLADANTVKLGPTGSGTAQTARDIGASVLISSGSGAGQLDVTSGVIKANLAQILGTALTETAGLLAGGFKKFFNVSSPTGTLNSLPDAVPAANGGLPTVDASNRLAGIQGTKNRLDDLNDITVASIWNALTSGMSTVGSIGKKLADWVVGTIDTYTGNTKQTGDTFALANGASGFVATKAIVDAIKAKTDNLPVDPADASDVAALISALSVFTTRIVGRGTVNGVPTTTSIPTSAFSPAGAVTDQFKGRILVFDNDTATAALRGQATTISGSSNAAAPTFTVVALTTAPAVGDTFSVT